MLFVSLALAHSPHDTASFVSVAPDGTALTAHNELLAWTTDGHSFDYVSLPGAWVECGWAVSSRVRLGVADGQLYWSDEANLIPIGPSPVRGCDRREWTLAAQGALWHSDNGWNWAQVATPGWNPIEIATFGSGWFGLDPNGQVFYLEGSTSIRVAEGPIHTLASDGQTVVLAPEGDWLRASRDGRDWHVVATGPIDVRALAIDGDLWLATTATEAVWASTNSGKSWRLRSENLEALSEGLGSPEDGVHYSGLAIHEGRWFLSSWEGFFSRPPDAPRWHQGALYTVPLVRGVQWLDDTLLTGVYGAGLYRGTPGMDDWVDVSHDVPWSYTRRFLATDDAWFLLVGVQVQRSTNQGQTWENTKAPADEPGEGITMDPQGRLWVAGYHEGLGRVMMSPDQGEHWSYAELPGCWRRPADVATDGEVVWAACEGRVYQSTDGARWEVVTSTPTDIQVILPADPAPLLGTQDGVWQDGVQLGLAGTMIYALARAPDGVVWASTGQGLVVLEPEPRSLGWPVGDVVQAIAFHEDGRVAAGTYDGAWWSDDGGQTWARANAWDLYDDREGSWWWSGWEPLTSAHAKARTLKRGGPGAHAEIDVEGALFSLSAMVSAPSVVDIGLDGQTTRLVWLPGPLGVRWQGAAEPGLHTLSIDVVAGEVAVDTVARWRERDAPPPEGDNGCSGGAGLLFLGLCQWRIRSGKQSCS